MNSFTKILALGAAEADARDASRYRWLRDGNAYRPEELFVRGGEELDALCDEEIAAKDRP